MITRRQMLLGSVGAAVAGLTPITLRAYDPLDPLQNPAFAGTNSNPWRLMDYQALIYGEVEEEIDLRWIPISGNA